ncbi:MAG: hypothetical protein EB078_03775 [Proteobacteria bacterium]|nr:hypothetical protein [Pseudomonadota bacterium]
MAVPTSRETFKEYCLRKLGKPVIEINVDDDQVEDRIDEALRYYWDYHFDGSERVYYKHIITEQNVTDKYITLPENIIGAVRIFNIGDPMVTNNLFDIRYQIALNDLYTLTSVSMIPYYMMFQHIQHMEQLLVGQQPIRYTRHTDKLYVDMDWGKVRVGNYLIVEAYQIIDPDVYTDAWGDRWLALYATALIKKQWGTNLTKFSGLQLPGGVQFNGDKIYNDAYAEVEELEKEMLTSYSLPAHDMIG